MGHGVRRRVRRSSSMRRRCACSGAGDSLRVLDIHTEKRYLQSIPIETVTRHLFIAIRIKLLLLVDCRRKVHALARRCTTFALITPQLFLGSNALTNEANDCDREGTQTLRNVSAGRYRRLCFVERSQHIRS